MSRDMTKPTKWLCAKRRLGSAWASAQSDQRRSSLGAQWVAKDPNFLHADSEDSDQTGPMPRLIWLFAGRTWHFVGFVMRRLRCTICKPEYLMLNFFMRTAKTLIRLGGCPGWSEPSLGAHSFCWFCHVVAHINTKNSVKQFKQPFPDMSLVMRKPVFGVSDETQTGLHSHRS